MSRKWKVIILVVITCFAVLGFMGWRFIQRMVHGVEDVGGLQQAVPAAAKQLPKLDVGEADWPCWRGPLGDGKSAQTGIITDWSGGLKKHWEIGFLCTGKTVSTFSAPAIRGNRLITMGRDGKNDLVLCLDASSGELLWKQSYPSKSKSSSYGKGARGTPCIDGDKVYTFSRAGIIGCWQLFDGKQVWLKDTRKLGSKEPQWGHSCSPMVVDDIVVVQAGGSARAIAFKKDTGEVAWQSGNGKAGYASPALLEADGNKQILIFHAGGLTAHQQTDGKELWSIEWITSHGVNAPTPAVDGNIVFITSGYGTGCSAISVDKSTAKQLWTNKIIVSKHSDPIIIDGHVYSYSGDSSQNKGHLKCVELKTGAEKWSTGEVGWGTMTYADGYLICLDIKGNLHLVKPSPKSFTKVATMAKTLPGIKNPAWTTPVIANGRLYLRYRQRLLCYDIAVSTKSAPTPAE